MPVSEIKIAAEPIFKVGERVASPVEGAGCPEPLLVFELKRTRGSAGSFDFDLGVSASVHEPDVGHTRVIPEASGVTAFDKTIRECFEETDDFVLNLFFGSHKNFPFCLRKFTIRYDESAV